MPYIISTAKYIRNIYSLYNIRNNACIKTYALYNIYGKVYKKTITPYII